MLLCLHHGASLKFTEAQTDAAELALYLIDTLRQYKCLYDNRLQYTEGVRQVN